MLVILLVGVAAGYPAGEIARGSGPGLLGDAAGFNPIGLRAVVEMSEIWPSGVRLRFTHHSQLLAPPMGGPLPSNLSEGRQVSAHERLFAAARDRLHGSPREGPGVRAIAGVPLRPLLPAPRAPQASHIP